MNEKILLTVAVILFVGILTMQFVPAPVQETIVHNSLPVNELSGAEAVNANGITKVSVNVINTLTESKVIVP